MTLSCTYVALSPSLSCRDEFGIYNASLDEGPTGVRDDNTEYLLMVTRQQPAKCFSPALLSK